MKRRHFLGTTLAALITSPARAAEGNVPHILLRNGWQSINIGDIAHQMGMLELLETHLPEVRISFWASKLDHGVEALVKSAGLFGNEMHSPILCIANGIPALLCRFKEQTSKGFMWRDIGLDTWLFDLDDAEDYKQIAPAILALAKDPAAAKAKAAAAREFVRKKQLEQLSTLKKIIRKSWFSPTDSGH